MKKIIGLMVVLFASAVSADSVIDGDTNNDGVLSGSEQYLLNNPQTGEVTREGISGAVQTSKIQDEIKAEQRNNARVEAFNNRVNQQSYNQSAGMKQAPHIDGMQSAMDAKYSSKHSDMQSQIDGQNAQMNAQIQRQQAQLQQQQAAQQRMNNQLRMDAASRLLR